MASIIKEIDIAARPENVWEAVRDFNAVHERLVPGFVTSSTPDGDGARVVTFFNGAVAREVLLGIDDDARRLCYTVVEGPLAATHHNASAQVSADGNGGSRFVWTTDVLPDEVAGRVDELMTAGIAIIKRTLEERP